MPFRFQKRITIFPGVTLNVGMGGVSISLGRRGLRVTLGRKGVKTSVGVPGTGIRYETSYKKPLGERDH